MPEAVPAPAEAEAGVNEEEVAPAPTTAAPTPAPTTSIPRGKKRGCAGCDDLRVELGAVRLELAELRGLLHAAVDRIALLERVIVLSPAPQVNS